MNLKSREMAVTFHEDRWGMMGGRKSAKPPLRQANPYSKWRALTLALVYALAAAHIIHWRLAGRTLAPLELNETMYTIELGIVTAGFLFMALAAVSTAIFGRFFCGWGCHILALEDLCFEILRKLEIHPKPLRSRLLVWVAPVAFFTMFVWPQVFRLWQGLPLPAWRIASDKEAWASFLTDDFWRNLPSPAVALNTFFVCGFLIVYLLGSRSFCRFICPYGVAFSLADRLAVARIRIKPGFSQENCLQCGRCTAVCSSSIRVHEEIGHSGMVTSSQCLKDLDCVAACPQSLIHVGFGKPILLEALPKNRPQPPPSDYTWAQEIGASAVFVFVFLSLRGLYGEVPFLLALVLGVIGAFGAIKAFSLMNDSSVRMANFQLKHSGKVAPVGKGFLGISLAASLFVAHSAWIRFHEHLGDSLLHQIQSSPNSNSPSLSLAKEAVRHFEICGDWGLLRPVGLERKLASLYGILGNSRKESDSLRRIVQSDPDDIEARIRLGGNLAAEGETGAALLQFRAAAQPRSARRFDEPMVRSLRAEAWSRIGSILLQSGKAREASTAYENSLNAAVTPTAKFGLGLSMGKQGLMQPAETALREAVQLDPSQLDFRLGYAEFLASVQNFRACHRELAEAARIAPLDPRAPFFDGKVWELQGQASQAQKCYRKALRIDPSNGQARLALEAISQRLQKGNRFP